MNQTPKLNKRGEPYKPGDLILDRYLPNATDVEREAARENLYGFVAALLRIARRQAEDEFGPEKPED